MSSQSLNDYFQSKLILEFVTSIPMISYGIYLMYTINTIFTKHTLEKPKTEMKKLNEKLKMTTIIILYFLYRFIFMIYIGFASNSEYLFLVLLLQLFEIFLCIFSLFAIRKFSILNVMSNFSNNNLNLSYYYRNLIYFWSFISFKILTEIIIEIQSGLFFKVISFSIIGFLSTISLTYMLYRYNDKYPTNNEVWYELQHLLPIVSEGNYTFNNSKKCELSSSITKFKLKKAATLSKPLIVNKRNSASSASSTLENNYIKNYIDDAVPIDEISQNQPEILPLYPKIKIVFKDQYKYIQQNDFDMRKSSLEFAKNFFFQILVIINEKNINHTVKRSIQDFLDLQQIIKMEITRDLYPKKLCERIPNLKIPKNYFSRDFFKNYKVNFEMFLQTIVNEHCFVTDDVQNFLEVHDDQLKFSYDLARKKVSNISSKLSKINDDFKIDSNKVNKNDVNFLRESMKKFTGKSNSNNSLINSRKNTKLLNNHNCVKLKILDIKKELVIKSPNSGLNTANIYLYVIIIRVMCNTTFKIVQKELTEISTMITEISNINKSNENIKNILKILNSSEIDDSYDTIKFRNLLENVLQNAMDNLKLHSGNHIIQDFFMGFIDNVISRESTLIIPNKNPTRRESQHDNLLNSRRVSTFNMENLLPSRRESMLNMENNLHSRRESGLVLDNHILSRRQSAMNFDNSPNSKREYQQQQYEYYIHLINSNLIINVNVDVIDTVFIQCEYKSRLFYVINFTLFLKNNTKKEITKKYKFKELSRYLKFLIFKLNIDDNFSLVHKLFFKNKEQVIEYRRVELQKKFTLVFSKIKYEEDKFWGEILYLDLCYQQIKSQNFSERNSAHKSSIVYQQRTESRDSILGINIRDSIL